MMSNTEAIMILECMAEDMVGALAGMKDGSPMADVLQQRIGAIDMAQEALRQTMGIADYIE